MKSEQLSDDFYPVIQVAIGDECVVVTNEYRKISNTYKGQTVNADAPHYGVIRWDTNKEADSLIIKGDLINDARMYQSQ